MRRFFLVAVTCFSFAQLKDVECKTYCKTAAGYDSGVYVAEKCWCADVISQDRLSEKKLSVPKKVSKARPSSPSIPYAPSEDITKLPWED
jgi:hypothetical protein